METIDVIKSRRSIRNYIHKEIPEKILEDIVDCGRLAPTGYNHQPWKFVVITEQRLKDKISGVAKYGKFIKDAGACIAVFCDVKAETPLEDACAATENMIIAAQSYNLGSCWVNSYKKPHSETVKELLNCPEDMELMVLLAVGYHEEEEKERNKKRLEEVMEWNSF